MNQYTESLFLFLFHELIPVELVEVQLQLWGLGKMFFWRCFSSGAAQFWVECRIQEDINIWFICNGDVFKAHLAFVVRSK